MNMNRHFGASLAMLALSTNLPAAVLKEPPTSAATPGRSALPPPQLPGKAAQKPNEVMQVDWDALLPEKERNNFAAEPPPPIHDYLGEGGMAARQSGSSAVNPALNGRTVKVPGFVVPLDMSPDGMTREFFLVPYFGACIHVPPPPPNQIVYVKMSQGIKIGSMYDAVWITGKLRAETKMSRMGAAAYTLAGEKLEPYKY
jgi:uncharacterized protein